MHAEMPMISMEDGTFPASAENLEPARRVRYPDPIPPLCKPQRRIA